MEIQVSELRKILALLKPVVPKKSALPITTNVLLKDGQAMATNLEQYVVVNLGPKLQGDGQVLLPPKTILQLVNRVPGNQRLTIERQGNLVTLQWQEGKHQYAADEPGDFPSIPTLTPILRHSISGAQLVPAIVSVLPFASSDETRPVLTGVALSLGEYLQVAAADGFRLGFKTLPVGLPPVEGVKTLILPAGAVEILQHLWTKAPPSTTDSSDLIDNILPRHKLLLEVGQRASMVKFSFGAITLYTRPIEGTPPDYQRLVPQEAKHILDVYAADMERALGMIKNIALNGSGAVRLSWVQGNMRVFAGDDVSSSVETNIPVSVSDGAGRIAVDIRYLLEYFKGRQGVVTMRVRDEKGPIVLHHYSSPVVVIMPLLVQWPGDPQPQTAEAKVAPTTETESEPEPEEQPTED